MDVNADAFAAELREQDAAAAADDAAAAGHECPKDGCTAPVPADMLACRPHWYSVAKPIRMAVWRAWDHGAGAGTPEHTRAIEAAISAMNRTTARPRTCCEGYPHFCPGCQRVMSHREAAEQDACNDCHAGVF